MARVEFRARFFAASARVAAAPVLVRIRDVHQAFRVRGDHVLGLSLQPCFLARCGQGPPRGAPARAPGASWASGRSRAPARAAAPGTPNHRRPARPGAPGPPWRRSTRPACGTSVFVAIIVVSAPSGHRAATVPHPKPDSVPSWMPAISPTHRMTKIAAGDRVRSFVDFMTTPPIPLRKADERRWRAPSLRRRWSPTLGRRTRSRRLRIRCSDPSTTRGQGFLFSVDSSMAS